MQNDIFPRKTEKVIKFLNHKWDMLDNFKSKGFKVSLDDLYAEFLNFEKANHKISNIHFKNSLLALASAKFIALTKLTDKTYQFIIASECYNYPATKAHKTITLVLTSFLMPLLVSLIVNLVFWLIK